MRVFKRKFKSGVRWGVDYTIGNVRKRLIVADTKKEAQEFLEEIVRNKKLIKIGLPPESNGKLIPKSINEALNIYFEERVPSLRSTSIIKTILGKESTFRKKFGSHCLDDVSKSDMEIFRDSLLKKNFAYQSTKRIMTVIQSFFTWAKKQKWLEAENPASSLFANCRTTTKNPGWIKHILTHEEIKRIIELARQENPERADLYLWLHLAMMRPSEAKRIRFENFDEDSWTLRISETKTAGKVKTIPIDGELREIYFRQLERREGDGFMWPQSYFEPHCRVFKRYCSELGINLHRGNGWYILKHSGVSFMVNVMGVPAKIVADISGVSVAMIFKHYLKANEAQLRLALQNASRHFSGTQEDKETSHPSQPLDIQASKQYTN